MKIKWDLESLLYLLFLLILGGGLLYIPLILILQDLGII